MDTEFKIRKRMGRKKVPIYYEQLSKRMPVIKQQGSFFQQEKGPYREVILL